MCGCSGCSHERVPEVLEGAREGGEGRRTQLEALEQAAHAEGEGGIVAAVAVKRVLAADGTRLKQQAGGLLVA